MPGWPDTLWLTEQQRVDRDYAAFGEASFDVTDHLTATAGVRAFKAHNTLIGFFGLGTGYSPTLGVGSYFTGPIVPKTPCTDLNKGVEESGYTHRFNLTYKFNDDHLVYATESTGFRPGGINRRGILPPYLADFLTNYEFGWKTSWLEGRLRFNGALYWDTWNNFQFSFLGSNGLTEIKNAGQAAMKGLETQIEWLVQPGLTLSGSAAYTDAALTANYCGTTDANGNPITNCASPLAPKGTQLPITPRYKANLTARYEFDAYGFPAHVQGSLVFQSGSWADLRIVERSILGRQPGYATADFSIGFESGNRTLELFVTNAFDERGQVSRYAECAIDVCGAQPYIVPIRPRTIGLRFGEAY